MVIIISEAVEDICRIWSLGSGEFKESLLNVYVSLLARGACSQQHYPLMLCLSPHSTLYSIAVLCRGGGRRRRWHNSGLGKERHPLREQCSISLNWVALAWQQHLESFINPTCVIVVSFSAAVCVFKACSPHGVSYYKPVCNMSYPLPGSPIKHPESISGSLMTAVLCFPRSWTSPL